MKVFRFLSDKFRDGIDYRDACQLCIWIHLAKNTIPSDLNAYAGEKHELAEAFALLARSGLITGKASRDMTQNYIDSSQHWLDVIKSAYLNTYVPDYDFPRRFNDIFGNRGKRSLS